MVLIRHISNKIIITTSDCVLQYNLTNNSVHEFRIPPPILPENLTSGQKNVLLKDTRTITSIAFTKECEYIAISTENKQVVVLDNKYNILKNFIVQRAASKLCFTTSNDILIADKTGDVYLYQFMNIEDCEPKLLIGHLSVILDLTISDCGKYLLTCDRDEKIRVSSFPNSYNIVSFCLGHQEFVTNIKLLNKILISASGDGTIRVWNYLEGKQLGIIDTSRICDKEILQEFSEQMDQEKVDVLTLPITDMHVSHYTNNDILIAVSLHKTEQIYIYKMNVDNFKGELFASVSTCSKYFSFYFSNHDLYVLNDNLAHYKLVENQFILEKDNFDKFVQCYSNIINFNDETSITVLYKRRYDNVQEYLERKRQRLELKS